MDNTLHPTKPASPAIPATRYSFSRNQLLVTGIVMLLLLVTLWIWKNMEIKALTRQHAEREQQMAMQSAAVLDTAQQHFLALLAKPYVWAIRTEMMQGNLAQVNLYGHDLVKEKNMVSVMVTDPGGKIVAATDKKFEGTPVSALQLPLQLDRDSTMVSKLPNQQYLVVSPIMGFNSKLGALIIQYAPNKSSLP